MTTRPTTDSMQSPRHETPPMPPSNTLECGDTTTPDPRTVVAPRGTGFALIEVLMATVLVGFAIASMNAMFISGSARVAYAQDPVTAHQLAREIHTLARRLPRDAADSTLITKAVDATALGTLAGAVFQPPIMADGTEYSSLPGWSQRVTLHLVSLDSPNTETALDPRSKQASDGSFMYQLSVTIHDGSSEVDTFKWWLSL
jgi:hypothetical protein